MPLIVDTVLGAAPLALSVSAGPLAIPDPFVFPAVLYDPVRDAADSSTDATPVPAHDDSAGLLAPTSLDDWYYRIHVVPGSFDFGNMVGDQQRTVLVWNAFFDGRELTAFSLEGDAGVTTDPVTVPSTFGPLEERSYVFDVSVVGSPVLAADASWTIDGVTFVVPFSGVRVVVFPFPPNWTSPVEDTLEHMTAMETTYTGKEQISELRAKPRRILQYNFRLWGNDANRFDNLLFGWTGRLFGVPLWHEKSKLQSAIAVNDDVLLLETDDRSFEAGQSIILYESATNYEVAEIETVGSGTLTLARGVVSAWPIRTRVFPIMVTAPGAQQSTKRSTDTHLDGLVRFTSHPSFAPIRLPTTAAPLTYRGEELFIGRHNWATPVQIEIEARQTMVDEGTGVFSLIRRASFPLITRGFRWLLRDRTYATTLRQFFGRRRGRLKPAWMPSGVRDFRLLQAAVSGDTTIYVEANDYESMIALHPARRDIVIVLRTGQIIARRIVSAAVDEFGRGVLSLDSALGVAVDPAKVKRISYLGLYRLASDQVTFSWVTDKVSQVNNNFVMKDAP